MSGKPTSARLLCALYCLKIVSSILLTIISRAIIENASSSRTTILSSALISLRALFFRPHSFVFSRPFVLVFALYAGTYMSANSLDTFSSTFAPLRTNSTSTSTKPDPRDPSTTTAGTPKFLATSATNLSLCVYKDSQFAKFFGSPTSSLTTPRPSVPPISLVLFGARDALTVFASFNLPPLIAPRVPFVAQRAGLGTEWEKHVSRTSAAQFLAPAAVQVISTPLHLLGLDLYNRKRSAGEISVRSRAERVWRDWGKSCVARICRILPAFGVGGVVNTRVRRWWMEELPSSAAGAAKKATGGNVSKM